MSRSRAILFGMPIDLLTMEETVVRCEELVVTGAHAQQASMNASKVVLASSNDALTCSMRSADIVTADGQSIVWVGRLLGVEIPGRVAGIDLMEQLLMLAERRGYPVFFLGARESVLLQFLAVARERYPQLLIVGACDGYFEDEASVVVRVRDSGARLLFIALPSPAKELFVERNRQSLGPLLAVGVGGSFDVWANVTSRAPRWMQRSGLEWLFRLIQEPRKLWRRYLVGNIQFLVLTLGELIRGAAKRRRCE
jgi:N-acetylglucosaminyldiphosphoundecaprenol N-acetyl-beta-D-mannosaminyltransferase